MSLSSGGSFFNAVAVRRREPSANDPFQPAPTALVPAASSVEPPPTSQTMNVLAADAVDATAPAKASAASSPDERARTRTGTAAARRSSRNRRRPESCSRPGAVTTTSIAVAPLHALMQSARRRHGPPQRSSRRRCRPPVARPSRHTRVPRELPSSYLPGVGRRAAGSCSSRRRRSRHARELTRLLLVCALPGARHQGVLGGTACASLTRRIPRPAAIWLERP